METNQPKDAVIASKERDRVIEEDRAENAAVDEARKARINPALRTGKRGNAHE
jgi:hypothetical protein